MSGNGTFAGTGLLESRSSTGALVGQTYILSFWAKGDVGDSFVSDAASTMFVIAKLIRDLDVVETSADGWKRYEYTFTQPFVNTQIPVFPYSVVIFVPAGSLLVDDVSFKRESCL